VAPRQAALVTEYGLQGDIQYQWSLDDATISWTRGGVEVLAGRITLLGTVSHEAGTWLWSWANDGIPAPARGDVERVRVIGAAHEFPVLASAGFAADQRTVPAARIAAADILDADGLWLDRQDGMDLHFTLHDLRRPGR
jgi:uncharacterized protein DUF6882